MFTLFANNKILIFLQLFFASFCYQIQGSKFDVKNEDNYENMKNFEEEILSDRNLCYNTNAVEDCEDDRGGLAYIKQYGRREPMQNVHFSTRISDKTIRTPSVNSNQAFSCSCEMGSHITDLGVAVYPRYVESKLCKTERCHGGFRCHPKKYQIYLVKKKQLEDIEQPLIDETFPDTLKALYRPTTAEVTVACECIP